MKQNTILFSMILLFSVALLDAKSILPTRPTVLAELNQIHQSFLNGKEVVADKLIAVLQQEVTRDSSLTPALKAAEKLKSATEEKAKLEAYSELSESLKEYIQKDESTGMHVFYCPMVKKKWIASGDKVQNPYDSSMKSCGKKI
ncbi:LIC13259 family plasminogen/vitronectin/complement-binding protein [Leptospira yasudae]|uniref:DUF3347 domain-containing protein n=1 Tax=Leptospira yasudae TaxID=2202201 RepID=A0A6N4QJ54_9LEPT|nr:DUF3347 domain-containing protein [Leptospira yasudae]TGL74537.1 DUF3347 domain-containing protein [Leptospira yasudae]TGL76192.1 DUF3347 domain-containing protein [Leptospira yasudae]TGL79343.1 DUF3347 domain-containing protein [Leptospira yasudae]